MDIPETRSGNSLDGLADGRFRFHGGTRVHASGRRALVCSAVASIREEEWVLHLSVARPQLCDKGVHVPRHPGREGVPPPPPPPAAHPRPHVKNDITKWRVEAARRGARHACATFHSGVAGPTRPSTPGCRVWLPLPRGPPRMVRGGRGRRRAARPPAARAAARRRAAPVPRGTRP